jgi:hypothetical protein
LKKKREYLLFLEKAILAIEAAMDAFNSVSGRYKTEANLLLLSNAWELLAKSVLIKSHQPIAATLEGATISAEVAISRLKSRGIIDANQEDCLQQVISLRNYAAHSVLPTIADEILHHLTFFSCKFFRDVIQAVFPSHVDRLRESYLSLSFGNMTTYADKVQKLVGRIRKNEESKKLVWLLERGVKFDGTKYVNQKEFEDSYKRKRKVLSQLDLNYFLRGTDMVRVVAVQAPKNFTADISLRKGSSSDASLPVIIKKTNVESDFPFLTKEIADKIGKNANFVATTIKFLGLKGNNQFHQAVRASKTGVIHRYSQAALDQIKSYLASNPSFNPYAEVRKQASRPVSTHPKQRNA